MAPLAAAMQNRARKNRDLSGVRHIDTQNPCTVAPMCGAIPPSSSRSPDVADLWALERAHAVNARYHVRGGHALAPRRHRPAGIFRSMRWCRAPTIRR